MQTHGGTGRERQVISAKRDSHRIQSTLNMERVSMSPRASQVKVSRYSAQSGFTISLSHDRTIM